MKRIISILLISLVLCLIFSSCNKDKGNDNSESLAPDITVYSATGKAVSLSDLKGKAVVLNFFASWCPPCKAEMPAIQKAYEQYGNEVEFLIVNLVGWESGPTDGRVFIEGTDYTFPVYYDLDLTADQKYSFDSIPQTFFIDKDGNIADTHSGMISYLGLTNGIEKIK